MYALIKKDVIKNLWGKDGSQRNKITATGNLKKLRRRGTTKDYPRHGILFNCG